VKPKILKSEAEYSAALAKVESLMEAKPGSKQEEELELWSLLIDRYEQEHHEIDFPDPIEASRLPHRTRIKHFKSLFSTLSGF
jgi:HTH-type transcriptional regulator/antitoxin HigA